jgi:hypothetical protein
MGKIIGNGKTKTTKDLGMIILGKIIGSGSPAKYIRPTFVAVALLVLGTLVLVGVSDPNDGSTVRQAIGKIIGHGTGA